MTHATVTRIEGVVQAVILLFMGGMAGAASFVHIHDLTVHHGQPSWIGWANAVVIELMSIVAGLEIRRRKRTGRPIAFVVVVLLAAVGISLAAQVATAEPSIWGWIVAALPALGLLAVVKIVLTRTSTQISPERHPTAAADRFRPVAVTSADHLTDRPAPIEEVHPGIPATGQPRSGAGPTAGQPGVTAQRDQPEIRPTPGSLTPRGERGPDRADRTSFLGPQHHHQRRTKPLATPTGPVGPDHLDAHLVSLGRTVAERLNLQRRPLTRDNLAKGIRAAGHTIGTDRAGTLLRQLKTSSEMINPRTPPVPSRR